MSDYKPFEVDQVPLKGKNLIEASAGTGKTYSIAILVLRLILEQGLSIREVLMVTFTKAAVAELEERIRFFVRTAYLAVQQIPVSDHLITNLVERANQKKGIVQVTDILREAVLFLDETSVQTIHGFCQKTLLEFAFETGQLFEPEILTDTGPLLDEQINIFWRMEITTLPANLLEKLLESGFNRKALLDVVRPHLDGRSYYKYEAGASYSLCEADHQETLRLIEKFVAEEAYLRGSLLEHVIATRDEIMKLGTDANVKRYLLPHLTDPEFFLSSLWKKQDSQYVQKAFPDLLTQLGSCNDVKLEQGKVLQDLVSRLNCLAIERITFGFEAYKERLNLLSFDDMIVRLHYALGLPVATEPNGPSKPLQVNTGAKNTQKERLITALRKKYKAVFIDEFQDTDKYQFEIFSELFRSDTILFYIADPKQSIYGFRKADIFTYFIALGSVDERYSMNKNYRSTPELIKAMNHFFLPAFGFDTFYFRNARSTINYLEVEAPSQTTRNVLTQGNSPATPITIFTELKTGLIVNTCAALTVELLEGKNYLIKTSAEASNNTKKIKPSDIGILVRTHNQGRKIKEALSRYAIPAVTIDDFKVLQSAEARLLLYIMEAILEVNISAIKRALLSPLTRIDRKGILSLDTDKAVNDFRSYKVSWETSGIYTALMSFVKDYRVKRVLDDTMNPGRERLISNFFQLIELVHQVQNQKQLSPADLISWLRRSYEGMPTQGDEYEQRIENDEEAVKIVTIHNSKGLEYNIVLAPFLDFTVITDKVVTFRDDEREDYVVSEEHWLTDEQKENYRSQAEQENRRLLYVAVTRAVLACFLFKNTYFKNSTLQCFLDAAKQHPSHLIGFSASPAVRTGYSYFPNTVEKAGLPRVETGFLLPGNNWTKMSYTMLAQKNQSPPRLKPAGKAQSDYDRFVFHDLARGQETGNMLHYIFEYIGFQDYSSWPQVIKTALLQYYPRATYKELLEVLLDHVLHVQLSGLGPPFELGSIPAEKRLHEFEFDFNVGSFNPLVLNKVFNDLAHVNPKFQTNLEGMMNGKLDLLFEDQGLFYILDWKSNYLGDSLESYNAASLELAMTENNYHLQYLIYTVAAKKYLSSRLQGFNYDKQFGGVIYLFIRGIRRGSETGIFMKKPSLADILTLEKLLAGTAFPVAAVQ